MVVHPDDHDRGTRSSPGKHRQPPDARGSEYRLVDDHGRRCHPAEKPEQVREVRGGSERLDPLLALEQPPERRPDPLVTRGDEDRHGRPAESERLHGHEQRIDGGGARLIRARG